VSDHPTAIYDSLIKAIERPLSGAARTQKEKEELPGGKPPSAKSSESKDILGRLGELIEEEGYDDLIRPRERSTRSTSLSEMSHEELVAYAKALENRSSFLDQHDVRADVGWLMLEVLAALTHEVIASTTTTINELFDSEVKELGLRPAAPRPSVTVLDFSKNEPGLSIEATCNWIPASVSTGQEQLAFRTTWNSTTWRLAGTLANGARRIEVADKVLRLAVQLDPSMESDPGTGVTFDLWLKGADPRILSVLSHPDAEWTVEWPSGKCRRVQVWRRDNLPSNSKHVNQVDAWPHSWLNGNGFFLWEWLAFEVGEEHGSLWPKRPGGGSEAANSQAGKFTWLTVALKLQRSREILKLLEGEDIEWRPSCLPAVNGRWKNGNQDLRPLLALSPWFQWWDLETAGARANSDRKGEQFTNKSQNSGVKKRPTGAAAAADRTGGTDGENERDFRLKRAILLSTRGRPATVKDWQDLVEIMVPTGLIASVAAAESSHYDPASHAWGRGVDLLLIGAIEDRDLQTTQGAVPERKGDEKEENTEKKAKERMRASVLKSFQGLVGFSDQLRSQIEMIRPLGTSVRLYLARPICTSLELKSEAVIKDRRDEAMKELAGATRPPGQNPLQGRYGFSKTGDPSFSWASFVAEQFRQYRDVFPTKAYEPKKSFLEFLARVVPNLKEFKTWDDGYATLIPNEVEDLFPTSLGYLYWDVLVLTSVTVDGGRDD
jgi:hypothetical protein